jgi:hypothetical protein
VPLVIFFHGGGFSHGHKEHAYKRQNEIHAFLEQGIAFATCNYRFYRKDDSIGVGRCLNDVTRAIQYLRHHQEKFGIDGSRIAAYGASAGAGSSLYLAFHDDLAIPGDTSLLGQSTRLSCAGALATQATYDVFRWKKYIPGLGLVSLIKRKDLYQSMAGFYGFPDYSSFKALKKQITPRFDMLEMISSDDPPVYVRNMQKKRFPGSYGTIYHHRRHALELEKHLIEKRVEHLVYVYRKSRTGQEQGEASVAEFLMKHLLSKAP